MNSTGPRTRQRLFALAIGIVLPLVGVMVTESLLAVLNLPRAAPRLHAFQATDGRVLLTRELGFVEKPELFVPSLQDRVAFSRQRQGIALRVGVVGESTAAGFPFYPYLSFGRVLESMLRELFGRDDLEVLNLGRAADPSAEVLAVAQESLATLDLDILVVYSGHNEFQWPYCEDYRVRGPAANVLRAWKQLRLRRLLVERTGREARTAAPLDSAVRGDPDRLVQDRGFIEVASRERGVDRYLEHVRAIVQSARHARVPVLLVTQCANLRDFAPNQSAFAESTPREQRTHIERELRRWEAALSNHTASPQDPALRSALDRLLEIDDSVARLHFLRGRCCEAVDRSEAIREYVLAASLDTYPNRALPAQNRGLEALADGADVFVCSAATEFQQRSLYGVPGDDLFLDHCHPTVEATFLLAAVVLRDLGPILELRDLPRPRNALSMASLLGVEQIERRLADFGLDRARLATQAIGAAESVLLAHLESPSSSASLDLARLGFEKALRVDPRQARAHLGLGLVHLLRGEAESAKACIDRALEEDAVAAQWIEALVSSPTLQRALHECGLQWTSGEMLWSRPREN